ncbi:MAG: lysophospholipid acyltransferase family protein [Chitinophagales bacterium]|nr:lysophospholipid acyltransferase family protein [Chitinophagales bacterium]MDW8419768.1 lysophospholipid acyltransferase family protein [Chitinophagales bacterium]
MILYYLLFPFLYLLAHLPSSALYRFAEVLAWVLHRVVRYRRQVVLDNLRRSFPDFSNEQIQQTAAAFYRHLAYRIVENIRCMAITAREVDARITVENIDAINHYYNQGRHVVLLLGHIAAWEYSGFKMCIACKHRPYSFVSNIRNRYFDVRIQRTRARMGMQLVPMQEAPSFFRKKLTEPSLIVFLGDQSPPNPRRAYRTTFLNQPTPFFTGGERYARIHNCVVIYPEIVQVKRGYYKARLIEITDNPLALPENEITERYARLLERQIRNYPPDWLWSHRRWKHT